MNSGIYCIRNVINDKRYIGSAKNFEKRKIRHFGCLMSNTHPNIKLQRAFSKYGKDSFVFEVLEELEYTLDTREKVLSREAYWVNIFDSYKQGYNMTVTGCWCGDNISGHPRKSQILEKLSIKRKINKTLYWQLVKEGKKAMPIVTESAKIRKSEKLSQYWAKVHSGEIDKTCSEETKQKIREKQLNHWSRIRAGEIPTPTRAHLFGKSNHMYGKCHTEHAKNSISCKKKKEWAILHDGSEESNIKLAKALSDRSESSKKMWETRDRTMAEDTRKKISNTIKSTGSSVISAKKMWETRDRVVKPETRIKMSCGIFLKNEREREERAIRALLEEYEQIKDILHSM